MISNPVKLFLGAVLVFVLGVGLGLSLKPGFAPQVTSPKSFLENKAVQSVSLGVFGIVTKIEDQEITIENEGDPLTFAVREDTSITRLKTPLLQEVTETEPAAPAPPTEEVIALGDISIGNQLVASLREESIGEFVAQSIVISSE